MAILVFYGELDHTHPTVPQYVIGLAVLTVGTGVFYWLQERRRPRAGEGRS